MAKNEISLLSDNLQEIYTAVHSGDERKDAELVPNITGSRVYYARAGWGRFWRVFFAVWGFCFGDSLKLRKLKKAMQKTQAIFSKEKVNIDNLFESYRKELCSQFIEKKGNHKTYIRARYAINNWNDKTLPFIRLNAKGTNVKLNKVFTSLLPNQATPFSHNDLVTTTGKYQAIIEVERHLESPLPYSILQKLSLQIRLAPDEELTIEEWIRQVNNKSKALTLNKMRKAFDIMFEFIEEKIINNNWGKPSLGLLCMELAYRGCNVFLDDDPKHTQWRQALTPGTVIICNRKEYTLGEMLGEAKKVDKRHVYRIQGDKKKVIIIGNNTMILSIQQLMVDKLSWGILPATWYEVDASGTCALVEYLPYELRITEKNKDRTAIIIQHLQWILKQKATPLSFNSTHLRYDDQKKIRNCKVSLKSPILDFYQAENFAFECSNGNPIIYKEIMEKSTMDTHLYAKYYREVVESAINGDDIGVENLAVFNRYQIVEPHIIRHAKALFQEVEATKKAILNKLMTNYNVHDICQLGITIQNTMKAKIKAAGTASILWPNLQEDVVKEILKSNNLPMKGYSNTALARLA